jgi:hypothetical protein
MRAITKRISYAASVQQPCSNPSKSPELLEKELMQKYDDLQEFCKLQKSPANYHAAFTHSGEYRGNRSQQTRQARVAPRGLDVPALLPAWGSR